MQSEILDTERLLIANGETPSIFFRFPGLVSDAALMQAVRRDHLVVLGADGWLVFAPPLRPGAILHQRRSVTGVGARYVTGN